MSNRRVEIFWDELRPFLADQLDDVRDQQRQLRDAGLIVRDRVTALEAALVAAQNNIASRLTALETAVALIKQRLP